jgi:D-alanyl-D-alanine dipeptidase
MDIRTIVPNAIIDLRYATTNNFVGIQLYPGDARCLVHQSMASGLATAAQTLTRAGALLVFWDCYRPHAVQIRMFQAVPNEDWVAKPESYATSHEAGRSVDVTLAYADPTGACSGPRVQGYCRFDMGTDFDDFTPRATAYATAGLSAQQISSRALLRTSMVAFRRTGVTHPTSAAHRAGQLSVAEAAAQVRRVVDPRGRYTSER